MEYPRAVYPYGRDGEMVIAWSQDDENKIMGKPVVPEKPKATTLKKKQMFTLED